jgi:N-methylhydantoinase A
VQPEVARYMHNLEAQLEKSGAANGRLYILKSDGGLTSARSAADNPVSVMMSGPAGGVVGAVWVAEQAGFEDFLTFDMGGTSTDVALVQGLQPRIGRETTVGDLKVRATSVDVRTVGAGGGSLAHVPALTQALRVGPQSAGASPGPAAYAAGGTEPAVTDANVVLGYLPTDLAGGEITLDREAAKAAVQKIVDATSLATVEEAAAGIIDVVNENMFGALRLVSVQQGFDPRDFALVAFGGAGPLHANAIGVLMGSWPVIIPPSPGVLCAYGDATTSVRDESVRTWIRGFGDLSDDSLKEAFEERARNAVATLHAEGISDEEIALKYSADVRYHGQGFEIPIEVDLSLFDGEGGGLAALRTAFDVEHQRLFSFLLENNEHELVTMRATATGPRPNVSSLTLAEGGTDPKAALTSTTKIYVSGKWEEANVYDRTKLLAGNVVAGPAIVTEMDSTTLILPQHAGTVHPSGSILIRPTTSN